MDQDFSLATLPQGNPGRDQVNIRGKGRSGARKISFFAATSYAGALLLMLHLFNKAWCYRYAPLFVIAGILLWHSLQFNFVTDDAYISFVFSENFAEHGQLVFNHGLTPVEGYTNFLWTFLLGGLMILGLPPEIMSLILGTGFAMATLVIVFKLSEYIAGEKSAWDYIAPLFLALSSGFACWSSGGLETQMFSFFVALALYAYVRADRDAKFYKIVGIALALSAMTRPEGLLITALVGGHRLVLNLVVQRRVRPRKEELFCVGIFLLLWAPWFAWRFWYYGHFFPNTYYVKAAGAASAGYTEQMHKNGMHYIVQWASQSKVLYGFPLVAFGLISWMRKRSPGLVYGSLALLVTLVYLAYAIRVGGDFMGLHRFIMPLFVIAAMGTGLGLRKLSTMAAALIGTNVQVYVVAALPIILFAVSQFHLTQESVRWGNWKSDNGIDTPSYLAVYAHDRKLIGEHMRSCFEEDDFSIFGGVGAKPYHAKTKGIDVFGLVSEVVAHQVPRTRPRAGHNKWAPNTLLYDTYRPDFVFHCYSLHRDANKPAMNCGTSGTRFWESKGYKQFTLHVKGLLERGEYYTFFVSGDRSPSFEENCPGIVK